MTTSEKEKNKTKWRRLRLFFTSRCTSGRPPARRRRPSWDRFGCPTPSRPCPRPSRSRECRRSVWNYFWVFRMFRISLLLATFLTPFLPYLAFMSVFSLTMVLLGFLPGFLSFTSPKTSHFFPELLQAEKVFEAGVTERIGALIISFRIEEIFGEVQI